ncbi:MAG: D-hexose-6-phosphate mutarotase [Vibrionaceae bacterium]
MKQRLTYLKTLSSSVNLAQLEDLHVLQIQHKKAQALISLFGGQLLSFKPAGQDELIWLSDKADLSGKTPIRGGIPICWPWFGKANLPAHGFARTSLWQLSHCHENDAGVQITLTLQEDANTLALWPHAFTLEMQFTIGDSLDVRLNVKNSGSKPFFFGGALHTYFAVRDISKTQVTQLGRHYTEHGKNYASDGTANFTGEVDRNYLQASATVSIIQEIEPTIEVHNSGNNAVVVWNPGQALCAKMSDMSADGYQSMVCVESAIYDNQMPLASGQHSLLSTRIARVPSAR